MNMGSLVDLCGSPAKLYPFSTLCLERIDNNLLLISLTIAFLGHSRRVMGLVLFKSYAHGFGLGTGYTKARFHASGRIDFPRQLHIKIQNFFFVCTPMFLSISLLILDGPGALLGGRLLSTVSHSSSVGADIRSL